MKPEWLASSARIVLAALVFLSPWPALGQDTEKAQAEMKAAIEAANKAKVTGPSDVKLVEQAVLKLPRGYVYIPAAEGAKLLGAMGNRVGDGLLGLVFPEGEPQWLIAM